MLRVDPCVGEEPAWREDVHVVGNPVELSDRLVGRGRVWQMLEDVKAGDRPEALIGEGYGSHVAEGRAR